MPGSTLARLCRLFFHGLPLGLAAVLLMAGVAVNLANVVGRYAFQNAIYWAEEAMVYMAIWSIFLASVAIAYDRAHLTMDLFATRLSPRWGRLADGAITAVTVAVCLFMAWQSLTITRTLIRNGQNSLALELPMAIPQSALLVCFVLIGAAVVARFILRVVDDNDRAPERAAS
jgi:TRAP-type C4-dicarboxylate transport system permease small subunit